MRGFTATAALFFFATTLQLSADASAASSLEQAKKELQEARAELTAAVKRIRKDPPENADLDAAVKAVDRLKAAIDAGVSFEPKDLGYAKLALAARKQLRKDRDYVTKRRAATHLFDRQRAIDAAVSALDAAAERVLGPDKSEEPKDFDAARSAAGKVERELALGKEFESQDAKFAKYMKDVAAKVADTRKKIDARATTITVEQHKARIAESTAELSKAVEALSKKDPTDADFEAADRAMSAVQKQLEVGKTLEAKDSGYRAHAGKIRSDLAKTKKKIDGIWKETGLARMKGEIEPALKDLRQAGSAIRGRNPSKDSLAVARTAAIVVRGLLEKTEKRKVDDAGFARYLRDAKKSLLEVEVTLLKRKLDPAKDEVTEALKTISGKNPGKDALNDAESKVKQARELMKEGDQLAKEDRGYASYARDLARRLSDAEKKIAARRDSLVVDQHRAQLDQAKDDLQKAMRNIEQRDPTDEQFGEAKTAAIVLEKTIAGDHPRDSRLNSYLRELRSFLNKSRKRLKERRLAVDVHRQRTRVNEARHAMYELLRGVGSRDVTSDQLDQVDASLAGLERVLSDGEKLAKKDREYARFARDVKKQIADSRKRVEKRRGDLAVDAEKGKVEPALEALTQSLEALNGLTLNADTVAAAEAALAKVDGALAAGAEAEKKLSDYRTWAQRTKTRVDRYRTRIAKKKLEVSAATGKAQLEEKVGIARTTVETAKLPGSTDGEVSAAATSVQAVMGVLENNAALEQKDRGYAIAANKAKRELVDLMGEVEIAKAALAFRDKTSELLANGDKAADAAASTENLREKKSAYEKAVQAFSACKDEGRSMSDGNAGLAKTVVLIVDGAPKLPKQVIAICGARANAAEPELKRVSGLVAFEDGPKKFYEKAKGLIAQDKKDDALKQFEECIFAGRLLSHKNPELKNQKLPVAGTTMTLTELVGACVKDAKALRKK